MGQNPSDPISTIKLEIDSMIMNHMYRAGSHQPLRDQDQDQDQRQEKCDAETHIQLWSHFGQALSGFIKSRDEIRAFRAQEEAVQLERDMAQAMLLLHEEAAQPSNTTGHASRGRRTERSDSWFGCGG